MCIKLYHKKQDLSIYQTLLQVDSERQRDLGPLRCLYSEHFLNITLPIPNEQNAIIQNTLSRSQYSDINYNDIEIVPLYRHQRGRREAEKLGRAHAEIRAHPRGLDSRRYTFNASVK